MATLNKQTNFKQNDYSEKETFNEAVEKLIDTVPAEVLGKTLASSDLPESQIITTLSRRSRTAFLTGEKYDYPMLKYVAPFMAFDGVVDENYSEMVTADGQSPYGDTTFGAAFGKSRNKAVRFTYVADTEYNRKTSILKDVLHNFKTTPEDSISAVFKSTENIMKDMEIYTSKQAWDILADRLQIIEVERVEGTADELLVERAADLVLRQFSKNSKTHVGVGTDPATAPGVITKGADSIQPTYNLKSTDFVVWATPEHENSVEFDGERPIFNWAGRKLPVAGFETLHLDDEGMSSAAATALEGCSLILQGMGGIKGVQDWKGSAVANAGQLEDVYHAFLTQDMYPKYNVPMIAFKLIDAPVIPSK